jgi:hypothetical protein
MSTVLLFKSSQGGFSISGAASEKVPYSSPIARPILRLSKLMAKSVKLILRMPNGSDDMNILPSVACCVEQFVVCYVANETL